MRSLGKYIIENDKFSIASLVSENGNACPKLQRICCAKRVYSQELFGRISHAGKCMDFGPSIGQILESSFGYPDIVVFEQIFAAASPKGRQDLSP